MKSSLPAFRIIALLEGISFLILIGVGMPLKYLYAMPAPNKVLGMVHGVLFIAYLFYLMQVRAEKRWGFGLTFMAFMASLLPFGTFILDARVLRKEK